MSIQSINKLLITCLFLLVTISCGGNNVQETIVTPPSIKIMPIDVSSSDSNEPGWQRLEVQTAIANSYSEFRLFIFDCAGKREISVTSDESRQESVNWWFDSDCTIITLPPGLIIRNPSNIAGQIPSNMTSIELRIPYADLQMTTFPQGAISSNKTANINLDTNFIDAGSINFPVYDETLLNAPNIGEVFELVAAKVSVDTFAELQNDSVLVQIRLQNTNSLDDTQFNQVTIAGVGSDGILREAEELGGQCRTPLVGNHRLLFNIDRAGPNQMVICNVKFTNIPANMHNFHIWFNPSCYLKR